MADIETKLRISAKADVTTAFKDVAAQIEAMSARVQRSQRQMVAEHKQTTNMFLQSAQSVEGAMGKMAGAMGFAVGAAGLFEFAKKAVTAFATLDEQAHTLGVQMKVSAEKVHEYFDKVAQVAGQASIPVEELTASFADLYKALKDPEKALKVLQPLAMAARGMAAPVADVVTLVGQMGNNLDIGADKASAMFDMIQKGTEGTRTTAAEATKGLADMSLAMRQVGETGEQGMRNALAMLVAVGKHTKSGEEAAANLQGLMGKVGSKKVDKSLQEFADVNVEDTLQDAQDKHLDEVKVFLKIVDDTLTKMATEKGTPLASRMQYLQKLIKAPEDRQTIQSLLESRDESRVIEERTSAQEAGASRAAYGKMQGSAKSGLIMAEDVLHEGLEEAGSLGAKAYKSLANPTPAAPAAPERDNSGEPIPGKFKPAEPKKRTWGDFFSQFSFVGSAGAAEAPHGGFPAIRGARPLVPSEPGSATERTAREQLEATRRIASLFGGADRIGAGGGILGGGAGGESPATDGAEAAQGRPRAAIAASGHGGRTGHAAGSAGGGHGGASAPGGGAGGGTPFTGTLAQNQREAYAAARGEGLSDSSARALVANMTGESLAKPGNRHWDRKHYSQGIVQWDDERTAAIKRKFGKEPRDMSVADQTRAAIWEYQTNPRFRATKKAMEGGGSAAEKMDPLVRNLEAPQYPDAEIQKRRGNLARLPKMDQAPAAPAVAAGPSQAHPTMGPFKPEQHSRNEKVNVKVAYQYEDVRGIRDRGEAQGRRTFERETKRARYNSFSDVGVA